MKNNTLHTKYSKLQSFIEKKNVTAVRGRFGIGKTTFLDAFIEHSKSKNIFLKFNANDFDYVKNPRLVFIENIITEIMKYSKKEWLKGNAHNIFKNLINISKNILLTHTGIDVNYESIIDELLKEDHTIKKKLNGIRTSIKKLIDNIDNDKHIVLMIDDLDRARPDFALEIFEIVKHLFDVDNLSIILVYNNEALEQIANTRYGQVPGEQYISKYVDNIYDHVEFNINEIIQILCDSGEYQWLSDYRRYYHIQVMVYYLKINNKTLREIIKAFKSILLSENTSQFLINHINQSLSPDFLSIFYGRILYLYFFEQNTIWYKINHHTIEFSMEIQ